MAEPRTLPVFPLSLVLFPGSALPLRIFEPRYLRMVSACLRAGQGFVVSLIRSGREAGAAAEFHEVGTVAQIEQWDRGADGMLQLLVRGEERVQVLDYRVAEDQLITARTVRLEAEPVTVVAARYAPLAALLEQVFVEHGVAPPDAERLADASWVSFRLAEILPMPMSRRQWLLELTNPDLRLEALAEIAATLADRHGADGRTRH